MRHAALPLAALVAALVLLVSPVRAQELLKNPSFEEGEPGAAPAGWFVPQPSWDGGYLVEVVGQGARDGAKCVRMSFDAARAKGAAGGRAGFGNMMQHMRAGAMRGKEVEFKAFVRAAGGARAQLWFRVDLEGGGGGFFDNMGDRPILTDEWEEYTIRGQVAPEAQSVNVGVMHIGGAGEVLIDGASLRIVGDIVPAAPPQPPAPLAGRALRNVEAFVRLAGYVRFFHPSDQSASANWDRFTIAGVRAVEDAPDARALAERLTTLFRPLAPTIVVVAEGEPAAAPDLRPAGTEAVGTIAWRHAGVNPSGSANPAGYTSERAAGALENPEGIPAPGTVVDRVLPGGVRCIVPVTLYTNAAGRTLPEGERPEFPAVTATPQDRSTRLAAVGAAWTLLRHFYPYWDVVKTDWDAALVEALTKAATDAGETEFLWTLRVLIAGLDDGHGLVFGPGENRQYLLPLVTTWVGDDLVVVKVPEPAGQTGIARGDVIVTIGGESVAERRVSLERGISGSPRWRAVRSNSEIRRYASPDALELALRRPDGRTYKASLSPVRVEKPQLFEEGGRPENGAEVAPGVYYFDLEGAKTEELAPLMEKFAAAKSLVFDMRGYPNTAGKALLSHLIDRDFVSAHWNIRVTTLPDRDPAGVSWTTGTWDCKPEAPRIAAKVAFITDARAISYAESCMGIVEHYRMGEIVGEPTAGANGNVNTVQLPGGYTFRYTGMQVLKHDNSQHHLVGIRPTVPCSRTIAGIAAGRDELLEKAIETVTAR